MRACVSACLSALPHSTSQAGVSQAEETELTIISLGHDSTVSPLSVLCQSSVSPLKVTQILMSIAYDDCVCRFDLSMACHARTTVLKCVFAYDIF